MSKRLLLRHAKQHSVTKIGHMLSEKHLNPFSSSVGLLSKLLLFKVLATCPHLYAKLEFHRRGAGFKNFRSRLASNPSILEPVNS